MFFLGALIFSIFSIVQRRLLGAQSALEFQTFMMPVLMGGIGGLILSNFVIRLRIANFKLSQSQEYLQDFMDNASDLIQSISPDGKILYTNRTWRETLGYSAEELAGLNIFNIIAEEFRPHCQTQMREVLGGRAIHARFAMIAKDGSRIYLDGMINCRFEKGVPVSTRGILRNVTESRFTEEKLRLAAKVYENINDGIFVTDHSGRFITTNQAFTVMTGYDNEEIEGKRPNTLILKEDNPEQSIRELHHAVGTLESWQGELDIRHKTQKRFPAYIKVSSVKDEEGFTSNYIGVITDVTERKEAEERLRHLATHDILTDLPNRMLFMERLQGAVRCAEQSGAQLAVLYIDLDGFKEINDTFGHDPGDALLKVIATRLKKTIDKNAIARFGGDEFVVLLERIGTDEEALRLARSILEVMAAPVKIAANEIKVTASIGISIYPNCPDPKCLLSRADAAMYQAKSQGKNAVVLLA